MADDFFRDDFIAEHANTQPRALGTIIDPESAPTILVAIFAKEAGLFLDFYLECIERQTYPKNKIQLYIRTNNNTDDTLDILKRWCDRVSGQYAGIEIDSRDIDYGFSEDVHEWNSARLSIIGELRNTSLKKAIEKKCQFYFTADADVFLIDTTIMELIALNLPIAAPYLRSDDPRRLWSNFFSDIDASGHHIRSKRYLMILSRATTGVHEVPLVHCCYAVRVDMLDKLSYTSTSSGYEFMRFAKSARDHGVIQYLDNRQLYGYCVTLDPKQKEKSLTMLAQCKQLIAAGRTR